MQVLLPCVGVKVVLERNDSVRRENEFSSEVGNEVAMLSTPSAVPRAGMSGREAVWRRGEEGDAIWDEGKELRTTSPGPEPKPAGPSVPQVMSPVHFC